MSATDRELADNLARVLAPFARAYVAQHPNIQVALAAQVMVRVDYLRDAYLALSHYEKERGKEQVY